MKLWSTWMEAGSKVFSCLGRRKGGAAVRLAGGGHCKVGWRTALDLPDSSSGCFLYCFRDPNGTTLISKDPGGTSCFSLLTTSFPHFLITNVNICDFSPRPH